jgi:hypothetical protein
VPVFRTGLVSRGQLVGISILTLRQRLGRNGVSHYSMFGTGRRIGTRRCDETFLLLTDAGARRARPARELLLQVHRNELLREHWPARLSGRVDESWTLPRGSLT